MNRIAALLIIVCLAFAGCATTGGMTPAQEDAICRLSGNALAETLKLVKPEYAVPAKTFCVLFVKAENAIEAKTVLENALTFLSDRYAEGSKLGNVVLNALILIGYDESKAQAALFKKVDASVKLDAFTADMWRKANLVVSGFCQML